LKRSELKLEYLDKFIEEEYFHDEIIKKEDKVPGIKIEKQGLEWLYNTSTLTSYIEDGNPILICSKDNTNPARICIGKGSDIFPVRPVITINKKYIAK